mmetsp:Transcript_27822/g.52182  ORF Transcript_27822/g.52182 Transcript_27822/m.52182 type:complete len:380 (-) Transcript_27822:19-1158(-)
MVVAFSLFSIVVFIVMATHFAPIVAIMVSIMTSTTSSSTSGHFPIIVFFVMSSMFLLLVSMTIVTVVVTLRVVASFVPTASSCTFSVVTVMTVTSASTPRWRSSTTPFASPRIIVIVIIITVIVVSSRGRLFLPFLLLFVSLSFLLGSFSVAAMTPLFLITAIVTSSSYNARIEFLYSVVLFLFFPFLLRDKIHWVFVSQSKVFISIVNARLRRVRRSGSRTSHTSRCSHLAFPGSRNHPTRCSSRCSHLVDTFLLISCIKVAPCCAVSNKFFSQKILFCLFFCVFFRQLTRRPSLVHPVDATIHHRLLSSDAIHFLLFPFLLDLTCQLLGLASLGGLFLFFDPYFFLVCLVLGVPALFTQKSKSLNHVFSGVVAFNME